MLSRGFGPEEVSPITGCECVIEDPMLAVRELPHSGTLRRLRGGGHSQQVSP